MSRPGREESATAAPGSSRRRFRTRLRTFLLLVALASIIAAAFALRARTVRIEEAVEHLYFHARRARVSAEWLKLHIEEETKRLDALPRITREWLADCEAKLLPSDMDPTGFAAAGKSLFIALNTNFVPSIWIGVFDEKGKLVLEHLDASRAMHDLLAPLARPDATVGLTGPAKQEAGALVVAILAEYEHYLQEGLTSSRAQYARDIAESERHEREAGAR